MFNRLELIKNQLNSKGIIIKEISRLNQGRNSSLFKVNTANQKYALKIYPENFVNKRNRIKSELDFLIFLKKNKFTTVPEPILWDKKNKWLLLSWINGEKILSPTKLHCKLLINFLQDIQLYKKSNFANNISNASEACFQLEEHINHVKFRVKFLLDNLMQPSNFNIKISPEIISFIEDLSNQIKIIERKEIIKINTKMIVEKVLSPSDVGFHNTLIDDNIMNFIDFEYAGWDDPSKMISDLILQPDYNIPIENIKVLNVFFHVKFLPDDFQVRIPIMLKLYRIKWIIIMLNPLLKEQICLSKTDIETIHERVVDYSNESNLRISNSLNQLLN